MKCIILDHSFNDAENGNRYCKLEVRPDNDVWADSFNYVMFVTPAMETALESNFPKFIWLDEKRIETPEPFYRVWATDGNGHSQGEFVTRPNKSDPDNPEMIVFNDIKVIVRTLPDGTLARGEDPEKLALSQWNRGIGNGTIVPISEYGEVGSTGSGDVFEGAVSATEDEGNTVIPADPATQRQGVRVPRR